MRSLLLLISVIMLYACQKTDINFKKDLNISVLNDEQFGYGFESIKPINTGRPPKKPHPTHPHDPQPDPPPPPPEEPPTEPPPTPEDPPLPPVYDDLMVYLSDKGFYNTEPYRGEIYFEPPTLKLNMDSVITIMRSNYVGYKVSFTTDSTVFLSANPNHRVRVVFTGTTLTPGQSGLAVIGSYNWGENAPVALIFADAMFSIAFYCAEIGSHELGHVIGMRHYHIWNDNCQIITSYPGGYIMGNPTFGGDSQWSPGSPCRIQGAEGIPGLSDHQVLSNTVGVR